MAQDSVVLATQARKSWEMKFTDKDSALQLARSTLVIAAQKNIGSIVADCHSTIGYILCSNNQYEIGYDTLFKCIQIWRRLGDSSKVANLFNTISSFQKEEGKYPEALKNALYALRLLKHIYDDQTGSGQEFKKMALRLGKNCLTLSVIYELQDMGDASMEYAKKGYMYIQESENKEALADASLCLANRYFLMRDSNVTFGDSALFYYNQYLLIPTEGQEKAYAYYNLAVLMLKKSPPELDRANKFIEQGYLALNAEEDDQEKDKALFFLHTVKADWYIAMDKNYAKAFIILEQAEKLGCLHNIESDMRLKFFLDYSTSAAMLGKNQIAFQMSEKARLLKDTLFNQGDERKMRQIEKNEHDLKIIEQQHKYQFMLSIVFFLLILLCFISILWYVQKRANNLKLRHKIKNLTQGFIEDMQRQERSDFAVELHDQIGTPLASLALVAETLKDKTVPDSDIHKLGLMLEKHLRERATYARNLSHKLEQGEGVDEYTKQIRLDEFLHNLSDLINTAGLAVVQCNVDPNTEDPNPKIKTKIGAIIDELIGNTLRHAKAKHIEIHIKKQDNELLVEYQDDGIGFKRGWRLGNSGGTSNIQKRVHDLGGKVIKFANGRDSGIIVTISIPYYI